ncbi:hypothetical protein BRADI_2g53023v3 [Brachypodium distachyon]|uniref:Uncharacterized protein n=1 Tax=Brachypodium distachyon TaxID=15368 RepID=A0A2K2DFM3_BRADI|nr:hypothetical protein BRADI_2g53023v3 [Brachypodium distachyon]
MDGYLHGPYAGAGKSVLHSGLCDVGSSKPPAGMMALPALLAPVTPEVLADADGLAASCSLFSLPAGACDVAPAGLPETLSETIRAKLQKVVEAYLLTGPAI